MRYVLEGSVRKAGNRLRITAQLIDATNGAHLWADRFEGSLEDVFDLQDKVAISVAGVIEPTLRQAEIERARRKRPHRLDAYALYLHALPYAFTPMPADADKALPLLGKAIELEPDFAPAHAIIAWCYEQRYLRGGMQEETRLADLHHARLAIAGGSDDAAALATAGFAIAVYGRDFETALTALDRSFALSGSSALALGFSSLVRAWRGDDAKIVVQQLLELQPGITVGTAILSARYVDPEISPRWQMRCAAPGYPKDDRDLPSRPLPQCRRAKTLSITG